jgi:NADH dehydrogenase
VNLVVGATGILGGEICRLLAERDAPLRALVRETSDPAKVESLRKLGAETVEGDLKDRESLAAACAGTAVVVSTASSTISRADGDTIESVDRDGQLALVDAAVAAGVGRFVYVSFTEMAVDSPLQGAKRAVEQRLQESELDYTILRPTHFMEVWLGPAVGFDVANATARIHGSGERKVSWISFRDVARLAVASLDDSELRRATVEFGGPEALSPLDAVRIFEEETGRTFALEHVPEEALERELETATDSLAQSFAALMLATARARRVAPANLPGLRSVRDYARELTGSAQR